MHAVHRLIRALSDLGMVLSVVVLVGMTLLILAEVALRNLTGGSTHVMNELVGYGVATMTMVALGHCLEEGALIRMTMLLGLFRPASATRRALEVAAVLMALLATSVALRYFLRSVARSLERGYVSETAARIPLWLPEAITAAGLAVLILQLLSYLLRLLAGAPAIAEGQADGLAGAPDTR